MHILLLNFTFRGFGDYWRALQFARQLHMRGHEITLMCGAPAVVNMVLDAAATWEGEIPGRDRVRIIMAGAPPPTKTVVRVQEELGWEARVHFAEGLERTVQWYRDNEDWWGPIRSGEYREYYEKQYGKALG